jgi:glucose/arabinose dehydrogenase
MRMKLVVLAAVVVFLVGGYYAYEYIKEKPPIQLIQLVPMGEEAPLIAASGFRATIFARDVSGARVITQDGNGTMLLSQTKEGRVVALPDRDQDGVSDETVAVLEGLAQPHGILVLCEALNRCTLYVAETGAVKAYAYNADTFSATFQKTITTLPTGDGHFTRTLLLHPDGRLLVSVGSSCNVCEEDDPRRAAVLAINLATDEVTTYATGLRNTVFMAVDPVSGAVWGTDNGRDLIGDDIPPDEVNVLEEGKSYGWPICYGNKIHDTDFDDKQYVRDPCADTVAPHVELQAHSAALGLAFVPTEGWPEDLRGDLIVAYHGSWNRSEPTGYKVVRFELGEDRRVLSGPIDFLTGFLAEGRDTDEAIGRPVDVYLASGGVGYISDDRAGAIYKIQAQ